MNSKQKIPVCYSVQEVRNFVESHREVNIILYLAHKEKEAWEKSTSRVYFNQISQNLVYLPVDIAKGDLRELRQIYELAKNTGHIIAINQTQPHKSNPVVKELFSESSEKLVNIDTIIKDQSAQLKAFDLNGSSFITWFLEDVGVFENKVVILIGVGGVGEPISKAIAPHKPSKMFLIDPQDKTILKTELSAYCFVEYYPNLDKLMSSNLMENLVLINAAGKEGIENNSTVHHFLKSHAAENNIFVDLRPHLQVEIVEQAKAFGWRAFTGHGMNAVNDYTLLSKVAEIANITMPSFARFKELVAKAS